MTNRLAQSQSLYLRKHAENPVDWWPWCDAALAKAEQEDKPIFLSIGYSSCHWCTVMEGEAFSDAAIAAYLNSHFLPIKVDREERPDLDSIYMQALQMMVGQGGWPLNVFLDPRDRVPFYGGTYFPVEPRYGQPGFLPLLQALHDNYTHHPEKVADIKSQIAAGLEQATLLPATDNLSSTLLQTGVLACARVLQPTNYGTCFPMIPYGLTALRGERLLTPTDALDQGIDSRQICYQRGQNLALGGIYDHVAGGFHRYTVDPTWTVPHFEKMLYDNGLIVEFLADLWSLGEQDPAFERAIAGTVQWLTREMQAPAGYFYAAQDADSFTDSDAIEPEEGDFYVWRTAELKDLLSEAEYAALAQQFYIEADGNFEGRHVLQRRQLGELSPEAEAALERLFEARYGQPPAAVKTFPPAPDAQTAKTQPWPGRIPPVTDTKMIVAWNSLMISGLARAAAVLNRQDYLELAMQAASFIRQNQWVEGRLHRLSYDGQPATLAQAEDYALLVKALLDIQQACLAFSDLSAQATEWLNSAVQVQQEFDQGCWSETGGYFNTTAAASGDLLVRERSYQDSAIPAPNGVAIASLVRLALLTEDLSYLDRAEQSLRSFGVVIEKAARACPGLFQGLDHFRHPVLVRTSAKRLPALLQQYLPSAVFAVESNLPSDAVGLVCRGLTCLEPAMDDAQFSTQIQHSQI
ncbi:thioredoxin domain-containing protein [Romeria aff. gracilis LEGE 07310]|uniref:Thioredoxin domain-containing protein n=1 Tax=Vasconcelosia minhoensis LEGE 07310 TaxID=915328 RepID=A0A8J7AM17_9CYAN|nr:thioredoxin domain-containing protein [Romeria gracilis]MBE9076914.1 thioredoxin domain-containing protein [Romeria aff. gracilis LEGE 07310]